MSEQQQVRSEESLRHEYTEILLSIRNYGNLRFAVFSIFFAVIGGVGFAAFGKGQFDAHAAMLARLGGFAAIALFWWYAERLDQLFSHHINETVKLEQSLGYRHFSSRPTQPRFLPNFRIVGRGFFSLLTLLWAYAAFSVPLHH